MVLEIATVKFPMFCVFFCVKIHKQISDVITEEAIVLECNIDDMNPEHYDFLLEQLFEAGASDAWLVANDHEKIKAGYQSFLFYAKKSWWKS